MKSLSNNEHYSACWVLRPASVRGVEVAKPSAAAKARVKSSKKKSIPLAANQITHCALGLATTTVAIYYIKVKFRGR